MRLTLNIDPDVFRGEVVQNFKVVHEGKELVISVYVSRGHLLKMRFNGPLDFRIIRYKTNELPDSNNVDTDNTSTSRNRRS